METTSQHASDLCDAAEEHDENGKQKQREHGHEVQAASVFSGLQVAHT